MAQANKARQQVPFALMMVDDKLNWIQIKEGEAKRGIKALISKFEEFHGYKPSKTKVFICHPETKWDGIAGYSIPQGAWAPVEVK